MRSQLFATTFVKYERKIPEQDKVMPQDRHNQAPDRGRTIQVPPLFRMESAAKIEKPEITTHTA